MRTLLVSAYGCEPDRGSEPGVGWHFVLELAKQNRLLVITRANNEKAIARALPPGLRERVTFFYYDPPRVVRILKRRDRGLYPYYFIWQMGIVRLANRLVATYGVDYVLHVTFGSIWMPTFLGGLGVPLIWGPLGGGEGVPREHLRTLPMRQRLIQGSRSILVATVRVNPLVSRTMRQAAAILARTHETADLVPAVHRHKTRILLETAIETESDLCGAEPMPTGTAVRLVTTGRLVALKNTAAAIAAVSLLPASYEVHLEVVGDGPERRRCERLVEALGLQRRVTFAGELPRTEVLERLARADIFVFPSMKECGSWSLMEAMAMGLPSICLRWTGMRVIADDATAVMLDPHDREGLSGSIAMAIRRLVENPDLAAALGAAAKRKMETEFTWAAKGAFFEQLLGELDSAGRAR